MVYIIDHHKQGEKDWQKKLEENSAILLDKKWLPTGNINIIMYIGSNYNFVMN